MGMSGYTPNLPPMEIEVSRTLSASARVQVEDG